MRACTFGLTATMLRIRSTGLRLNAVDSASALVAVGTITPHRGHIVKNTGDGLLAEFNSVAAAIS